MTPDQGDPNRAASDISGALRRSARSLKRGAITLNEETDRRTLWAADRTVLAAERTYAAWVRTSLAALASGVGARTLLEKVIPLLFARLTGSVLILFSGFCLVAAIWREFYSIPRRRTRLTPIPRLVLIPVNGFLLIVTV